MEWQNLPAPCLPKVRPWSPPLIPPSETWHGKKTGGAYGWGDPSLP